jgi:hypothetical protein
MLRACWLHFPENGAAAMTEEQWDDEEEEIRPGDPDYDLSEAHGYLWEPRHREWPPRWLILGITLVVIVGLLLPALILIARA